MAGLSTEALTISGLGIDRRHRVARPSKQRLELRSRSAIVRGSRRSNLAHAVRRARHASGTASITKRITETLFGQRLATFADDEGEVTAWTSVECFRQDRQHRHDGRNREPAFFGLDPTNAVVNVLAAVPHGIASTKAAIEQHIEPHPLARSNRPSPLIHRDVLLSPRDEAVALPARRVFNSSGRIVLDVLGRESPSE